MGDAPDCAEGRQRLRTGDPVLFAADACLIVRRPGMACGLCREACPAGVLSGGLWSISLDTAGCIGCGICAAECPTWAISVEGFATIPAATTPEPVALECRRVPEPLRVAGAVTVPCLGGLTTADLVDRVAAAQSGIAIIDRGWCADCPVGGCAAPWGANLAVARDLLEAVDPKQAALLAVAEVPLPIAEAQPVAALRPELVPSRRDFFRRLIAPAPVPHSAEKSQRIVFGRGLVRPIARQRLLATLRKVADAAELPLAPQLMPTVTIDDAACHLHGICAAICPTGALRLTEPDRSTMAIEYDAEACISCGECERVCPGKALRLDTAGDGNLPQGRVTLIERAQGNCMGCGDTFPQGTGDMQLYCQPCRNSRAIIQSMANLRTARPSAGVSRASGTILGRKESGNG